MALLHLRKIDYFIRYVQFYRIFFLTIHTQVNRQPSVARILFAGFFEIFSSSINKILLDAQIKEYNTKLATRPNTYDEEHNNVDTTPTAPQVPFLPQNYPLSLVPQNLRNLAITNIPSFRPSTAQSPIQHNDKSFTK